MWATGLMRLPWMPVCAVARHCRRRRGFGLGEGPAAHLTVEIYEIYVYQVTNYSILTTH